MRALVAFLAAANAFCVIAAAAPATPARPNILFIASDDLNTNLGCYGDPVAKTPNLDRLASKGIVFEHAYCQQALCNPSRASLLTGRQPDTLRVWNLGRHFRETFPDIVTLPQWFKRNGYFTQNIGKIFHSGKTKIQGDPDSWSVPSKLHWGFEKDEGSRQPTSASTIHDTEMRDVPDETYVDGRAAAEGIAALRALKGSSEPFFLALGFRKPHRPFDAPKRYWDLYDPAKIPPPAVAAPPKDAPAMSVESQLKDLVKEVQRSADSARVYRHGYYAMISYMDAQVGKVVDELKRLGMAGNTIIVFWSDHGFQVGEHGMWGKTSLFEYDARVPLIIVPPAGFPRGARASGLVELMDLFPTLIELAQLPPIDGLEGESFLPLLKNPKAPGKPAAFTQHPRPWGMKNPEGTEAEAMGYSTRTADWRYTEWRAWRTGAVLARELYDESADPLETRNVVADASYSEAVRQGHALLVSRFGASAPGALAQTSGRVSAPVPSGSDGKAAASFENTIGMRLMPVPAGSFLMGGTSPFADADEARAHRVEIAQAFFMAATEVTNAQYEQFAPEHRRERGRYRFSKADDEPVVLVSWDDATAFCAWLSRKEGRLYRLPTEAEWEYACRAGTTTAFWTGDAFLEEFDRNNPADLRKVRTDWGVGANETRLRVAQTKPNPWGLYDMHGNVEEWCQDWYGPYVAEAQVSPVGRETGISRVTRSGSHSTQWRYLRSANRSSALPEDKHQFIGFRVVMGPAPTGKPLPPPPPKIWGVNVNPAPAKWQASTAPLFVPPVPYVTGPASGEVMFPHNHQPTLAWCANGDLLATWYSCEAESGREMKIMASRLPAGSSAWTPAADFFCVADRNTTGSALFHDGKGRLYFMNGCSSAQTNRENLALVASVSDDNGVTWSTPRIVDGERGNDQHINQPIASMFQLRDGTVVCPTDQPMRKSGSHPAGGGTALWMSRDRGETWQLASGTIAGIHASIVELLDGRLFAAGRGVKRTPQVILATPFSISTDRGESWSYRDGPFPPIGGGQRLILTRLREGPILFVGFTDFQDGGKIAMRFPVTAENAAVGYGLYAAVSFDEGESWPVRKLLTDGVTRELDGGAHTKQFTMDADHAETKGYMACAQTPDNVIHLISSRLHYRFNLAWLRQLPSAQTKADSRDTSGN
jgi:formylglycine-generating enzyme